jgi:hypothetical protein
MRTIEEIRTLLEEIKIDLETMNSFIQNEDYHTGIFHLKNSLIHIKNLMYWISKEKKHPITLKK